LGGYLSEAFLWLDMKYRGLEPVLRLLSEQKTGDRQKPISRFWLWATKKIFLLFLRMNSNSCKNEILAMQG